jgi:hypothetical protein
MVTSRAEQDLKPTIDLYFRFFTRLVRWGWSVGFAVAAIFLKSSRLRIFVRITTYLGADVTLLK